MGARAMKDDTAKESIGRRYRVLGVLGQGGMGTVLLAKDRLDGHIALKRLTPAVDQWESALRTLGRPDAPTPQLLQTVGGGSAYAPSRAPSADAGTLASPNLTVAGVVEDRGGFAT